MYIDEKIIWNGVNKMDDAKIVQLYLDRNEKAILVTADKYGKYCISIARNILGNVEDAEECVNDTYHNTWNTIPPQRPKMLSTFLGKITRNLAFNRYKHNVADKRGGGELPAVLDELAECVSGNNNVEQAYEYKELVTNINDFLSELQVKKRNIFMCRYWYADSIADIAARYGMTVPAVTMILARIRTQLHDYLVERGYEL